MPQSDDVAEGFIKGRTKVQKDGKEFYIDKTGKQTNK